MAAISSSMVLLGLATVIALTSICMKGAEAQTPLNCYSCSGSGEVNPNDNCWAPTTTTLATPCAVNVPCKTTLTYSGQSSHIISYARGCGTTASPKNQCVNNECYCSTGDKCNNLVPVQPESGGLSCYVCDSLDVFDNGCGEMFNPDSGYVLQKEGCKTCGKNIIKQANGVLRYSRTCNRYPGEIGSNGGCEEMLPGTCTAECEESLCNTAATNRNTGLVLALAALIAARLIIA